MLRPLSTATRDVVSLDGLWNFDLVKNIANETAWSLPIQSKVQVPVPASYNDIFLDPEVHDHVGWVRYQRTIRIPHTWSNLRYFVRCDAATHHGRVYAHGNMLVDHQGGYTPFDAEVTGHAKPGQELLLTIMVNNELTKETIPPGTITTLPDGRRKQTYMHDFFNYAGLARSVWLYSLPTEHFTDVAVTTNVDWDASLGVIKYDLKANTKDDQRGLIAKVSVTDEGGNRVAEATGFREELKIPAVKLWQPGNAYLYQVTSELWNSNLTTLIDTYTTPVGVRTVAVNGTQFLINNKPFYFTGFGKHEDTAVRGKGHDPAYMVHDFELMKWLGANSFRTSHYPYAEEVLDYADRHGVVVIDETAAVGLNLGISSGLTGTNPPKSFSPDSFNNRTRAAHEQGIRELIARDKNHASVVMWTIANEPASHEDGAREYFEPLVKVTRSMDSRPVAFANVGAATSEKDKITDMFDVICLNRYYGWYENPGDLKLAETDLEKDLRGWQTKYKKPILMTEYGADTIAGLHSTGVTLWSEEFQTAMLNVYHRVFDRVEAVIGEHVWNFADFQTSLGVFRVDGNKKGIFTRDRRPKSAAQALRQRWLKEGKGNTTK